VIRQQAGEKGVDAALIAAVIYSESKFSDQTSSAGARGLMQITPETAKEVKRHSGGVKFTLDDLSDPEINIRYGTYVLRELLDRFEGDEVAALAAYNAGPGNVEKWGGSDLTLGGIPFPETRAYVEEVLDKRDAYRDKYARELGYR
jgi:soluble lytic murein transglycosylase